MSDLRNDYSMIVSMFRNYILDLYNDYSMIVSVYINYTRSVE